MCLLMVQVLRLLDLLHTDRQELVVSSRHDHCQVKVEKTIDFELDFDWIVWYLLNLVPFPFFEHLRHADMPCL